MGLLRRLQAGRSRVLGSGGWRGRGGRGDPHRSVPAGRAREGPGPRSARRARPGGQGPGA
ncbi:multifunctional oxoglutarate decarboxylase/oxoglutarate dehydrogenase thiamine pyrophosphate-binding subunit/dihydrolipoyllysine-residue succinyltransferase subunit, partial [Streptomyces variabilis]